VAERGGALVRAAGGVVWRVHKGRVEIALVHRPRYDDWALPKGKLEPGETELAAGVREVREELGSEVAVSRRIGRSSYRIDGATKQVTFWVMRHLDGEFRATNEIDDVQWLPAKQARKAMSYEIEREVVRDFSLVPLPESVIVLLRHARAGKRSEWRGDDTLRPLDPLGVEQAMRLTEFLRRFAPDRIVSADRVRCVQTVQPLADVLGLDVLLDPVFSDEGYARSPGRAETALLALAKPGRVTVICSQGDAIPGLVDRLTRGTRSTDTRKGAAWVLSTVDGTVVSADYYEDAAQ
jgi:8-oxo-dGTP diphosphatase